MRADRSPEADARAIETAAPFDQIWQGLARYWRKRGEACRFLSRKSQAQVPAFSCDSNGRLASRASAACGL